jgi:hypothetical protein
MIMPEFNTYANLHRLADILVVGWGKRVAFIRAAELCGIGIIGEEHQREFNIMREYIQRF